MTQPVSPRSRPATTTLKASEKAAALLLYMGKPLASRLLMQFDADEVTRSIAELGT
jgi:flagellar motor switch protein FliG